jgi:hypothetical protein
LTCRVRGCWLGPVDGPAQEAEDALDGTVAAYQDRGDQGQRDGQRDGSVGRSQGCA